MAYVSSSAEKSIMLMRDCEAAVRSQQSDFERGARAWDVYKAIAGSQYTDKKRKVFQEEDRHPWQFDFASAKVDTLAGSLSAELPDPDWLPYAGKKTSGTEAIVEAYYLDKELFNYEMVLLETIRDGCVHSGWMQLYESKKYDPLGNIALRRIKPGYLIPDPYWLTSDDRDLTCLYLIGYYSADKLKQQWKRSSDEINRALRDLKDGKKDIAPSDRRDMQLRREGRVGDEYRVIEKHYVDTKETMRLTGLREGTDPTSTQQLSWIPFPVTERRDVLQRFAEKNRIDWETVQELPYTKRTHMVTTVTDLDPEISLEDGRSRVQCNGLPFMHYTTTRVNGQDKGIAESISDLQMMFNERMSHVHELVAKASGGSEIWNEDLFKNAQDKQRFVKLGNKPGHKEFAALDDVKNIKEAVGHIQVNPAIFQQVAVLYNELLPIISRVSDSMSAVSSSEDTGVLFEKKYQMNRISNIMFDKYAKQLINSLGECYYYQFHETYGGAEREITARNGQTISLNKRTEDGSIINSVDHIPRCRVVVSEKLNSPTKQMNQRYKVAEIIRAIPPDDYLRLNAAMAIYFKNMELAPDDQNMMDQVSTMNDIKGQVQFMTEIAGLKANIANSAVMTKQAEQLLQKLEAMEQQMTAAQGGGAANVEQQITGPGDITEPPDSGMPPQQRLTQENIEEIGQPEGEYASIGESEPSVPVV